VDPRFSQAIGPISRTRPFSSVAVPTCKLLTVAPFRTAPVYAGLKS